MTDEMASRQSKACNEARNTAIQNLDVAVNPDQRFPENVFKGAWDVFLFFDPDLLFEADFVETAKAFLQLEKGTCVCMRLLDADVTDSRYEDESLYIESETTKEAFMAMLRGPTVGSGWLYRMDRYAYGSNSGRWCIYCERNNEIAVIAIRDDSTCDRLQQAIARLKALSVERAIAQPASYGLSSRGLPPEWRDRLIHSYARRS